LAAEGVELGDAGEEDGDKGLEGKEGLDRVVAVAVEGLDGEVDVVRELAGGVENGLGEEAEKVTEIGGV